MKTLIVFSHLRWNFVYQRPQHLLTELSKFYKILYIEEPIKTEELPYFQVTQISSNIQVLVPCTSEDSAGFSDAQLRIIGPLIKGWMLQQDLSSGFGIWFYTPLPLTMKDVLLPEFIIFDVMDELSAFAGASKQLKVRETELLKLADLVIAGGPSLHRAKQEIRHDILLLPSSVDMFHFSPEHAAEIELETHFEDLLEHDIPHPRLGYFGVIDERLNLELIAAIADAEPSWYIIMVGPVVKIDPRLLPQRPNIKYLGMQDYAILPQIVQGWDVCLLPFAINEATQYISPTKTLEYLAGEKPIVSTPVHDVIELYNDVLAVGHNTEQFIGHIKELLNENPYHRKKRIEAGKRVLAQTSWNKAGDKVHQEIEKLFYNKL